MDDGDCHRTFPYYACIYNVCSPNGASYIVANSERSVVKWRNIWWKTYHQHRADLQTFLLCLFLVRFVYFIFFVPAWSCWCGLSICRSERQYSDWSHKFRISMNTAGHTLTIFLLFFVSPYGTNTFARILSISHLDCWFFVRQMIKLCESLPPMESEKTHYCLCSLFQWTLSRLM